MQTHEKKFTVAKCTWQKWDWQNACNLSDLVSSYLELLAMNESVTSHNAIRHQKKIASSVLMNVLWVVKIHLLPLQK